MGCQEVGLINESFKNRPHASLIFCFLSEHLAVKVRFPIKVDLKPLSPFSFFQTILASPGGDSIASTKALIGSYNFEDDDDTRDLFIKVDDPMRHTGKMESFVSYRVTTKVSICRVPY